MKVRTKIITSYLAAFVLILLFLGVNRLLLGTVVKNAETIYIEHTELRLEAEAKNLLWRQVLALTDFFLFEKEEHYREFYDIGKSFTKKAEELKPFLLDGKNEQKILEDILNKHSQFVNLFGKAVRIHKAGDKAEALRVEKEEIDPVEEEVEVLMKKLIDGEKENIKTSIDAIKRSKGIAIVFRFLSPIIEEGEELYKEGSTLQEALEGEGYFWREAVALTDFFLFGKDEYVSEFHQHTLSFQKAVENERAYVESDEEKNLLNAIEGKHKIFIDKFNKGVTAHKSADKSEAMKIESQEIDPAEEELHELLIEFYPLKVKDMEQAISSIRRTNSSILSVTDLFIVLLLIVIGMALIMGILIAISIARSVTKLKDAALEISKGKLGTRVIIKSKDEISFLAGSFNKMAEDLSGAMEKEKELAAAAAAAAASEKKKAEELASMNEELESTNEELRQTNEELESTIEELRTANEETLKAKEMADEKAEKLGRMNKFMTGRELRMVELKEEVNILLEELGKERKYRRETP